MASRAPMAEEGMEGPVRRHTSHQEEHDDIPPTDSTQRPKSALRSRKSRPRTAMGVTIGEPLTVLAETTPGPQYEIKDAFIRPKSAAYTIKSPYKFRALSHPGPDKYNTSGDMMFKKPSERPKSVALRRKGKTAPYHARHDFHVRDDPGAGHYKPQYTDTGRHAQKFTFGIRHKEGIHAGHVNRQIPPTDTHGFETPGPSYWPAEEVGEEHTFGLAKIYRYDTTGPGPLREDVADGIQHPVGITHVLASKLEKSLGISSPGPAEYYIPDTMGQGLATSLSSRHKPPKRFNGPSPTAYSPQRIQYAPSYTLTYREFETNSEPTPAPCDYPDKGDEVTLAYSSLPSHSMARHCFPIYPDILQYPQRSLMVENPSPNEHGSIRNFSKNHEPAYSMGGKHRQAKNTMPAPNAHPFEYSTPYAPHKPKPAKYSIAKTLTTPWNRRGFAPRGTNEDGPGPDTYLPDHTPCQDTVPSKTFGAKHEHLTKSTSCSPGPKYGLRVGTTCKGANSGRSASFKGRQSNYVFQGRQPRSFSAAA